MPLEWKDEYSVGVKKIDDQHKILIKAIADLFGYIGVPLKDKKINDLFGVLEKYSEVHFATEEQYFDKFKYELTEEHKATHNSFIEKVKELKERYSSDKYTVTYELVDFLEDWLINHIRHDDRKYMDFMKENGISDLIPSDKT